LGLALSWPLRPPLSGLTRRPAGKSPIPVPPIPDLAGNRGFPPGSGCGDSRRDSGRESPIPDSAKIGNQGIPGSRFKWPKIGKSGILIPCEYHWQTRSGGEMLPLILENADFRPPTHVSSGCQWPVASSVRQRPKSPWNSPAFPRRESPIPDSAKIGKRGIPVSRFGGNRETENPCFPIRPGPGIPESGSRWRRAGAFQPLLSGLGLRGRATARGEFTLH
jgi:hypothetical protein